jgi:hypothetical protein
VKRQKMRFKKMPKRILALMAILTCLTMFLVPGILAADTGDVSATVTVQNVAITVTDGTVEYGTLAASGTKDTVTLTDTQTANNTGNVQEDFNIKGYNVSSGCSWTLSSSTGSEQYFHKFCNDTDNDCATPPTSYSALTTDYATLGSDVTASGTVDFQLQIGVPSSTSCTDEATVTVTVQAVAG